MIVRKMVQCFKMAGYHHNWSPALLAPGRHGRFHRGRLVLYSQQ